MQAPQRSSYDVVIVGGAMYGSSVAWWLTEMSSFDGTVLVVERDPTYEFASTSHTNSCMRQQFSSPLNIRISQFAAEFVKNFRGFMGGDPRVPDVVLQSYGYMYLAGDEDAARTLKEAQIIQVQNGASTKHMSAAEIKADYPFYNIKDIYAGNHNLVDEGYFDGNTLFDWWKRSSRERGVEFIHNEVVGLQTSASQVETVKLASGTAVSVGTLVNCAGPRAVETSRMAGIEIPVEPRKRYTFIFQAEDPLEQDLPLTIDPTGVHMRTDGTYYLAGCPPDEDPAVDYTDFVQDHSIWEEKVWPVLAHRVPAFERIKLVNSWVGHYAFNTFDQNAIVGPHTQLRNFIFSNGFSGHGFQQSPALGRGIAEWIAYQEYRSLDLSPLGFDRIERQQKYMETAVI